MKDTLGHFSCVYTRVLTRVQLTSGREPSSNPPMDVGWSQSGLQSGLGDVHTGGESGLELSCKRGFCPRVRLSFRGQRN